MSRRGAALVLGGLMLAAVGFVYGTDPRTKSVETKGLSTLSPRVPQKGVPPVLPPAVTGSAGPAVPLHPTPSAPEVIAPIVREPGLEPQVPAIAPQSLPTSRPPNVPTEERAPKRQPTRLAAPKIPKSIVETPAEPRAANPGAAVVAPPRSMLRQAQQSERRTSRFETSSGVLPRVAPGPKAQPSPRVVNH